MFIYPRRFVQSNRSVLQYIISMAGRYLRFKGGKSMCCFDNFFFGDVRGRRDRDRDRDRLRFVCECREVRGDRDRDRDRRGDRRDSCGCNSRRRSRRC